jgi:hypothetical protein
MGYHLEVPMTDMLIRDVPDEVVADLDDAGVMSSVWR